MGRGLGLRRGCVHHPRDPQRREDRQLALERLMLGLRTRAGLDLDERFNPLEAGLREWISFDKGCYIGQEVIARRVADRVRPASAGESGNTAERAREPAPLALRFAVVALGIVAIALALLTIGVLVFIGARVYRGAALRTGARVSLREAWSSGD